MKKLLAKYSILGIFLLFIFYFLLILILWIFIKAYYGEFICNVSSNLISWLRDCDLVGIKRSGETFSVLYSFQKNMFSKLVKFGLDVHTSEFAYNTPLTLAIIAISIRYLKNIKVYLYAIIALVIVHILYVYFLQTTKVNHVMIDLDLEKISGFYDFTDQMIWAFMQTLIIRFEPFLMGAYLYIYYQKTKGE